MCVGRGDAAMIESGAHVERQTRTDAAARLQRAIIAQPLTRQVRPEERLQ